MKKMNLGNEIMMRTSPTMQINNYVDNYRTGAVDPVCYPERLDSWKETTKIDFTPKYNSCIADPILFQAKLEEKYDSDRLSRGCELLATGSKPLCSFDYDSIKHSKLKYNIETEPDSSSMMLNYLNKPKSIIDPMFFPKPEEPVYIPELDRGYLRNTLGVDIGLLNLKPHKESIDSSFSYKRDTLDMDISPYLPKTSIHNALYARDNLDIDITDQFKIPICTLPAEVPWAKHILDVDNGFKPYTGLSDSLDFTKDITKSIFPDSHLPKSSAYGLYKKKQEESPEWKYLSRFT